MSVLIFHDGQLLGIYDTWQHTRTLPRMSYIYNTQWYIVNNFGGAMPINKSDVPPAHIKYIQMMNLVLPK